MASVSKFTIGGGYKLGNARVKKEIIGDGLKPKQTDEL